MRYSILAGLIIIIFSGCTPDTQDQSSSDNQAIADSTFDRDMWQYKEGRDYPYRARMLHDVVYNDTIRDLDKEEILRLLGEPDRINNNHLYYMIDQKRLGFWPLSTKTMVIKISNRNTVEWIKIHG